MDEADPKDGTAGWLLAASMILVLVATGLRVASAFSDGRALLYASVACGAVAFVFLGAALWRSRDRRGR